MKQLLITIAAVVLVGCGEPSSELLQQSVTDGNVEAVKQHLADGADVNVKDEARGLTPLHFATQNGQKEIVELLIADGADVNAKMNNGMTPLDCSALIPPSSNKTEIVDLLSKHGGEASGVFGQAIKESEVNLNKELRGEN
jgi:ankyrin repeat protein